MPGQGPQGGPCWWVPSSQVTREGPAQPAIPALVDFFGEQPILPSVPLHALPAELVRVRGTGRSRHEPGCRAGSCRNMSHHRRIGCQQRCHLGPNRERLLLTRPPDWPAGAPLTPGERTP